MKTTWRIAWLASLIWLCSAPDALAGSLYYLNGVPRFRGPTPYRHYAQYKAPRQYMQRIAPQLPPPKAPATVPASPTVNPSPPGQSATPAVDPEKAAQEKAAAVKRAVQFERQRAEAGSASAQYELGKRYMTGDGVEKDLVQARKWLTAAAKQDHENAKAKLEQLKKIETEAAAPSSKKVKEGSVPK